MPAWELARRKPCLELALDECTRANGTVPALRTQGTPSAAPFHVEASDPDHFPSGKGRDASTMEMRFAYGGKIQNYTKG